MREGIEDGGVHKSSLYAKGTGGGLSRLTGYQDLVVANTQRIRRAKVSADSYFSLATTNSGAQSRARLISESGNVQIDRWADAAYSAARAFAASNDP